MKSQIKKLSIVGLFVIINLLAWSNIGCHKTEPSAGDGAAIEPSQAAKDWSPRPLQDMRYEVTAGRLERGKYLVEGVCHCFQCHTPGAKKEAGSQFYLDKPVNSKEGSGGVWGTEPYLLVVPNITPDPETGAGLWSDDALARAIREGVSHDGRVLSEEMPYKYYRVMSDEDLASIIVYLRSITPVSNRLPGTQLPEEVSRNIRPEPILAPILSPNFDDPVDRGKYLASLGRCAECHGEKHAGMGGFEQVEGLASANLTPDASTNLYYDVPVFIKAMHTGKVGARKLNPPMPWWYFGHMNEADLQAVYAFLRSLEPVRHRVDNTEPPSECSLCGTRHGFGNRNEVEKISANGIGPDVYNTLTGLYQDETDPSAAVMLTTDGYRFMIEMDGEKSDLLPASENEFFIEARYVHILVHRNRQGDATQLTLQQFNRSDRVLKRVPS